MLNRFVFFPTLGLYVLVEVIIGDDPVQMGKPVGLLHQFSLELLSLGNVLHNVIDRPEIPVLGFEHLLYVLPAGIIGGVRARIQL